MCERGEHAQHDHRPGVDPAGREQFGRVRAELQAAVPGQRRADPDASGPLGLVHRHRVHRAAQLGSRATPPGQRRAQLARGAGAGGHRTGASGQQDGVGGRDRVRPTNAAVPPGTPPRSARPGPARRRAARCRVAAARPSTRAGATARARRRGRAPGAAARSRPRPHRRRGPAGATAAIPAPGRRAPRRPRPARPPGTAAPPGRRPCAPDPGRAAPTSSRTAGLSRGRTQRTRHPATTRTTPAASDGDQPRDPRAAPAIPTSGPWPDAATASATAAAAMTMPTPTRTTRPGRRDTVPSKTACAASASTAAPTSGAVSAATTTAPPAATRRSHPRPASTAASSSHGTATAAPVTAECRRDGRWGHADERDPERGGTAATAQPAQDRPQQHRASAGRTRARRPARSPRPPTCREARAR